MELTDPVITGIFNECRPMLVASAIRFVGDVETAKDIVSDCFLGLLINRHKYTANDCRKILFSSVRNRCINEAIRRRRIYRNSIEWHIHAPFSESIEYRIVNKDLCRCIYTWMNSMPVKRRKVCELVYFRDMEPPEVAKELGIGIATVISQSRRMVIAVKERL
jgi:RNA polymerase sigma factor (sigma-70 family)